MFPNLRAEMAKAGHSREDAARRPSISGGEFEARMRKGSFRLAEIRQLCALYGRGFDYLFASPGRGGAGRGNEK